MIRHRIVEVAHSGWVSPVVLVGKPDGSHCLCVDFRKVNHVTKTESLPLPRLDDLIDRVGDAKFIETFDLMKGY